MAGRVLRLLPGTDYNFANVQGNTSVVLWTSQNIDVSRYREGTMLVRVHALQIGTTAQLPVALRAVLPATDDPGQFFRSQTDLAYVLLANGTPAPALQVAALPANFGGFVSLQLRPSQPLVPTTMAVTISVDLSVKD